MAELRQLDLHLALVRLRTLREDVEDQRGAIHHVDLQLPFEIALLRRRQRVIEDHEVDLVVADQRADLLDLAGPDERGRVGALALAGHHTLRVGACRAHQQLQLLEARGGVRATKVHRNQQGARVRRRLVAVGPAMDAPGHRRALEADFLAVFGPLG